VPSSRLNHALGPWYSWWIFGIKIVPFFVLVCHRHLYSDRESLTRLTALDLPAVRKGVMDTLVQYSR
jgi:hypothetical protein